MSKIIVITTIYIGNPSANGVCARNIIKELENAGHDVEVICYDNPNVSLQETDKHIHTVQAPTSETKGGLLRWLTKCRNRIWHLFVPNIKEELIENYYKKLCQINSEKKVDAVISMFFPLESVAALYRFKKQQPNVKSFVYELDSVGDGIGMTQSPLQTFYCGAYKRWTRKMYRRMDYVIILKCHEYYWDSVFGKEFINKKVVSDSPVLCPILHNNPESAEGHPISFIYAGLLEKKYRSPQKLLDSFELLNKQTPFVFDFFTKGDCEADISGMNVPAFKQNGYVSLERLEDAMLRADFFVSVGNKCSRSLPSKLISYISYGKPIIHFALQKNDICFEYLDRYPLSLVIPVNASAEEAALRIGEFVKANRGQHVPWEDIVMKFSENMPLHSAEIIEKLL